MAKNQDRILQSDAFPSLSEKQTAQILRQIQYHIDAPAEEELDLNGFISLRFRILPGVTRPMSSKGLAKWLWKSWALYKNKEVLDVGTGCGIQGIVCLLGGAKSVLFTDIAKSATQCALTNLRVSGLMGLSRVQVSNLFDSVQESSKFDLIVFAQPYFSGNPLGDFEFTRGMLDPEGLLHRFFQRARSYLNPDGCLVLMGWKFAGEGNDPEFIAPKFGFDLVKKDYYYDWTGVQQGEFHIVLFRPR